MKKWTPEEIEYLKRNYSNNLNRDIGNFIKKSKSGIDYMALKLGLKKNYEFYCKSRKKTNKNITLEFLKKSYFEDKKSIREIAKILGVGKTTVEYYFKKFDINRRFRSEANQIGATKYISWKKGLTKNNDSRIALIAKKAQKTFSLKKEKKIKSIENKYSKLIKEVINNLYWDGKLTQEKIAKELGFSRLAIIKIMKEFEITKRPNFEVISKLRGENHSKYGKTWEEVYGPEKAKWLKEKMSIISRKSIIRRLQNKEMPFFSTRIENLFAGEMSKRNISFLSQYNLGNFVCDFAIPSNKIIIECDGDYWHANPKIYGPEKINKIQKRKVQIDILKDNYLKEKGWTVLRFFESDILKSVSLCVNKVEEVMNSFQSKAD